MAAIEVQLTFQRAIGSGGSAITLRGKEASEAIYARVQTCVAENANVEMFSLRMLLAYGWLLLDAQKQDVQRLINDRYKVDAVSASTFAEPKAAAKKKGRKAVVPNARDAVLGLLD